MRLSENSLLRNVITHIPGNVWRSGIPKPNFQYATSGVPVHGATQPEILIALRTALCPNDFRYSEFRVPREEQYRRGFSALFAGVAFPERATFVLIDNTISSSSDLPRSWKDELPAHTEFQVYDDNKVGSVNKGAGDIIAWRKLRGRISQSDFFFHYEPRMILKNAEFIHGFLESPRNVACLANSPQQLLTGYFGCESSEILAFVDAIIVQRMIRRQVSIETLLYQWAVGRWDLWPEGGFCERYLADIDAYENY